MTPRFVPKGVKAEWRMIYDELLAEAEIGQVITYQEIERVIGRDLTPNRAPLYRAREYLGEQRRRWIEAVPTVGYRIAEPADHVRLSVDHKRRGRRQLGMAIKVLESTDLTLLGADELAKWDNQQKLTFALWAVVAHENRIRRIEAVLRKEGLL